ncbi:MAG: YigZ family protein [Prevotellaceae bacterium]|nr:YigZ family protein [Prevotellaceae bacterium]MDO4932213.1 YigZ family protein [Prevotellaceae bacterium]
MSDTYLTLASDAEGYYTEKRSKFYAFAHHVTSVEQVKELLSFYRKKFYDARHVCYAYRLGADGSVFRANDDGEPSSTAGKPILGALLSAGVTDAVIFVVRYYGGVNLGTGGLVVAYREASTAALAAATIEERLVEEQLTYTFTYPQMNSVMRVVKELQPRVISQDFQTTCSITLSIRKSMMPQLKQRLDNLAFE